MAGIEYLLTNLPRYVTITARSEIASSVVGQGALLLISEDGHSMTAKQADGTYKIIGIDPSDTTATAADVASGKLFYTAAGVLTAGTATGGGGTDVSDTTATAATVLAGYDFHLADGSKTTGTIQTVTASLSANVVTVPAGYIASAQTLTVAEAGTATVSGNTVTIPVGYIASARTVTVGTAKAAATYTPTTSDQTISSGQYLTGNQTIKGDANLLASNIVDGVTIFGVTGTASGGPMIPTTDLVFYAPLSSSAAAAVTGQTLTASNVTYSTVDGIPSASFGGSGYISFDDSALADGADARTISLWVRQSTEGTIYLAWNYGTGSGDEDLGIFVDARGGHGTIKAGTSETDFSLAALECYQYWRHVLLRYANGTAEVFVDGALIGTASITLDTVLTGTAYIGCSNPSTYNWNGSIAAVRVYNRALTREEIQTLAAELHPTT